MSQIYLCEVILFSFLGGVKFDKTIGYPIDWEVGLRYTV